MDLVQVLPDRVISLAVPIEGSSFVELVPTGSGHDVEAG